MLKWLWPGSVHFADALPCGADQCVLTVKFFQFATTDRCGEIASQRGARDTPGSSPAPRRCRASTPVEVDRHQRLQIEQAADRRGGNERRGRHAACSPVGRHAPRREVTASRVPRQRQSIAIDDSPPAAFHT